MPIYLQKPNGVTYKVRRAYNCDDLLFVHPIGGLDTVVDYISDSGGEFTTLIPCSYYLKVHRLHSPINDMLDSWGYKDYWGYLNSKAAEFYFNLNKFYDKEG
jgi:hypothetical protein